MKLVHWVLLTVLLVIVADVVTLVTIQVYRKVTISCALPGDVKREVHEVYPLLEK